MGCGTSTSKDVENPKYPMSKDFVNGAVAKTEDVAKSVENGKLNPEDLGKDIVKDVMSKSGINPAAATAEVLDTVPKASVASLSNAQSPIAVAETLELTKLADKVNDILPLTDKIGGMMADVLQIKRQSRSIEDIIRFGGGNDNDDINLLHQTSKGTIKAARKRGSLIQSSSLTETATTSMIHHVQSIINTHANSLTSIISSTDPTRSIEDTIRFGSENYTNENTILNTLLSKPKQLLTASTSMMPDITSLPANTPNLSSLQAATDQIERDLMNRGKGINLITETIHNEYIQQIERYLVTTPSIEDDIRFGSNNNIQTDLGQNISLCTQNTLQHAPTQAMNYLTTVHTTSSNLIDSNMNNTKNMINTAINTTTSRITTATQEVTDQSSLSASNLTNTISSVETGLNTSSETMNTTNLVQETIEKSRVDDTVNSASNMTGDIRKSSQSTVDTLTDNTDSAENLAEKIIAGNAPKKSVRELVEEREAVAKAAGNKMFKKAATDVKNMKTAISGWDTHLDGVTNGDKENKANEGENE
mmetsp:Transcript_6793/g.7021  ORF Transcript_6793/g.7021 Transcript_6793/m.7021 type:complete len:534 (-) Transcript_6793:130-1731(-)